MVGRSENQEIDSDTILLRALFLRSNIGFLEMVSPVFRTYCDRSLAKMFFLKIKQFQALLQQQ